MFSWEIDFFHSPSSNDIGVVVVVRCLLAVVFLCLEWLMVLLFAHSWPTTTSYTQASVFVSVAVAPTVAVSVSFCVAEWEFLLHRASAFGSFSYRVDVTVPPLSPTFYCLSPFFDWIRHGTCRYLSLSPWPLKFQPTAKLAHNLRPSQGKLALPLPRGLDPQKTYKINWGHFLPVASGQCPPLVRPGQGWASGPGPPCWPLSSARPQMSLMCILMDCGHVQVVEMVEPKKSQSPHSSTKHIFRKWERVVGVRQTVTRETIYSWVMRGVYGWVWPCQEYFTLHLFSNCVPWLWEHSCKKKKQARSLLLAIYAIVAKFTLILIPAQMR